jgi:hypothetical protein
MIMWLSLDDSVSDPNPVMDAGRINQRIQAIVPRFVWPMAPALSVAEAHLREAYFNSSLTKMVGISV